MSNMDELVDMSLNSIGDEFDAIYRRLDDIQGMLPDKDDVIDPDEVDSIATYKAKAMAGKKAVLEAMAYMEKKRLC